MSYGLVVTVPPSLEPITLAAAKGHLNVGHSDDDELIARLIQAAREQTENETGRRWMSQTLTLSLKGFPFRCGAGLYYSGTHDWPDSFPVIYLPFEPVSAVNAVRYYDAAGTLRTLAANTDYLTWLSHSPPVVYPAPSKYWPETQAGRLGAVEVEVVAGYASAAQVPATAKEAMLLAIGLWYEHRGDSEDPTEKGLPPAAIRLLRSLHTGHYS